MVTSITYQYTHDTGEGLDEPDRVEQVRVWCEEFGWVMEIHSDVNGDPILIITAPTSDESQVRGTIDYLKAEVW